MVLSCGVNDVWRGANGILLNDYKKNIRAIVDQVQAAGIKVMILTATMISENPDADNNKRLVAYNNFLCELAKEKKCQLADLNADMQKIISELSPETRKLGNYLTNDGVHMNPLGNIIMAKGVLRAFGMTDAHLHTAEQAWEKMSCCITVPITITLEQYRRLAEKATGAGKSLNQYLGTPLQEAANTLLK